jgi:hypothetical protein
MSVRSFYPIVNFPVNAPAQPQVHARIFQQTTKQGKSGVIDVSPFFFLLTHDRDDIGLPIEESSFHTVPVYTSVSFIRVISVQPSNAQSSLVLIEVFGSLRTVWQE